MCVPDTHEEEKNIENPHDGTIDGGRLEGGSLGLNCVRTEPQQDCANHITQDELRQAVGEIHLRVRWFEAFYADGLAVFEMHAKPHWFARIELGCILEGHGDLAGIGPILDNSRDKSGPDARQAGRSCIAYCEPRITPQTGWNRRALGSTWMKYDFFCLFPHRAALQPTTMLSSMLMNYSDYGVGQR